MVEPRSAAMQGRDEQLGLLREHVAATAVGKPSVVVVVGEAGIGKTRLVDEFTALLADDTVLLVRANCSPGAARELPLAAIREIVDGLRRLLGSRLDRVASVDSQAVAGLFASLDATARSGPSTSESSVGSQPQLFDLVARMLRGVARARRTLVVVEDIHWIDETSRDLLHFLARSLRDEQLMMVLTARTGDPDYESCRTLVADLTGLRHGTRVELPRLSADQVAAQVADLCRGGATGRAADTDVARVVAITEGVPLLVEEVLDAGLEDVGELADSLVGHRLARLSSPARTVVESAAVAVLEPTARQLAQAAPLPQGQFDEAFSEAVLGGVLVRRRDKVGFRHALLREATLRQLLPDAEKAHHRGWCSVVGDTPRGLAATVAAAHHRRGAGDLGGALEAYYEAALLSRRLSAYAEEKQLLVTAADLWPFVPDANTRTGTTLSDILAEAAWATHEGMTDLKEGQRLVDAAIAALPADISAHRRAMCTLLWHRLRSTEGPDARLSASEVLAVVADVTMDPPSEDAVLACLEATDALQKSGEPSRAGIYAARAVELAEAVDNTMLARALASLAMARARLGRYDDAVRDARRAVALAVRSGDLFAQVDTLTHLEIIEWLAGEETTATQVRLVNLLGGDRPGPLRGRWGLAQANHAEGLIDAGRWDEAQQVLDLVAAEDLPDWVFWAARRLADHLSVWRGNAMLPRGDDIPPDPHHRTLDENTNLDDLLAAGYTYADIEARSGDLLAARARVRFVAGDDRIVGNTGVLFPFLLVAARTEADLSVRGDDPAPEDGEWMVDRIHHLLELAPPRNPRDQAYAAHISAELARRDRTDSPVTWLAVVEAWRHFPRPFQLGSALLRAGEACRAAGEVPEAAAALREAVSIGEQLGAAPLVEEALTVARKTHLRLTSDVPRPVSALGLTRREIDVLRLVAEGSSNSAIARTLFISPKTVSVHVSNILAKLEVSNRGQAAALAHRAGLLAGGGPGRTSG